MANDKLYEATPSRLERARREGDVARSQEVCAVAAFGGGLIACVAMLPVLASTMHAAIVQSAAGSVTERAFVIICACALVPAAAAAAGAVFAGTLQTGGLHVVSIAPKFERLNPAENLRRMFSRETGVNALRATAAFFCAGAAVVPVIRSLSATATQSSGIGGLAAASWNGAWHAGAAACGIAAIFAFADYGLQRARHRQRLRMSSDEFKRDRKEHEGDPLMRSRRRTLHRQLARTSLYRVKDAAFVVANPTHVAIALEYRPPAVAVPRVLVRAADEPALRVRDEACKHGIPIVENPPLARQLYAATHAGDFIPHETYIAVAEIVAALSLEPKRS